MNEIIDLFFDFCKLIHSKISLAFNWIFTLNKLTFLTAIFSAYAAFMSYQVSEKATLLSLRLANDQTLQQKPQVALIGGVVTQTMINVDKNEYEYLVEIKIKNPSLRPAIDFGFSILLPTQPFDQHLEFTRGQIDKDIEFTLQKRFINSGSLKFDVNDIGYLSFAYIDR